MSAGFTYKSDILLLTHFVPACSGYDTLYSCSLCLFSDVSHLLCVVECRSGGGYLGTFLSHYVCIVSVVSFKLMQDWCC
jgi:hypothetical protein